MRKAPSRIVGDDAYTLTTLIVGPLQDDDPMPDAATWAASRAAVWRAWEHEARHGTNDRTGPHLLTVPFGARRYDGVRCRPIDGFPRTREKLAEFVAEDRATLAPVPPVQRAMLERLLDFADRCPSGWDMKTLTDVAGGEAAVPWIWSENLRKIATGELTWDGERWAEDAVA